MNSAVTVSPNDIKSRHEDLQRMQTAIMEVLEKDKDYFETDEKKKVLMKGGAEVVAELIGITVKFDDISVNGSTEITYSVKSRAFDSSGGEIAQGISSRRSSNGEDVNTTAKM